MLIDTLSKRVNFGCQNLLLYIKKILCSYASESLHQILTLSKQRLPFLLVPPIPSMPSQIVSHQNSPPCSPRQSLSFNGDSFFLLEELLPFDFSDCPFTRSAGLTSDDFLSRLGFVLNSSGMMFDMIGLSSSFCGVRSYC